MYQLFGVQASLFPFTLLSLVKIDTKNEKKNEKK